MHRKRTADEYEEAFIWCISRTNKEVSFLKNRTISIYKLSRTGYEKLAHFQNGVSILRELFLERGANLESRAAHTHPKNTQVQQSPLLVGNIGYEHRLAFLSTGQTKMDRNQNNTKYSNFYKPLKTVFENF